MSLKNKKPVLLGVLFISTLATVAFLLKMLTKDWPLALTTLGGFISLGVALWGSSASKEKNETWKLHVALIAAFGGLMSIGSGLLAKFEQSAKDQAQREQSIRHERLLTDNKQTSEDNRQLSRENKQLSEENKGLSQENRKLLTELNKQNVELGRYLSGGVVSAFSNLYRLGQTDMH